MPIETICQGCSKRLRVADEHAGKLAKCPHCQAIYTVPQSAAAASWGAGSTTDASLAASDRWHLKTPDGLSFGPVSLAELDRWLADGRITAASQIMHEADGQWVVANQIYPHLASFTAESPRKPVPMPQAINPYAAPTTAFPFAPSRFREPHRGGVILALAIVGIFVCDILSVVALVMGIIDLSKMNRGEMDPSGRGLTIAGIVIAVLKIVVIAFVIAAMAFLD
jgi:hypothetical protein